MDEQNKLWEKQRKKRGFDDRELWSLDVTIAKFILPRLRAYAKGTGTIPKKADLRKMIKAFDLVVKNDGSPFVSDSKYTEIKEGLYLFAEHFMVLWT